MWGVFLRVCISTVTQISAAKALWKLTEVWKNQRTVFPQLLEPSVHSSHNATTAGFSDTTILLLLLLFLPGGETCGDLQRSRARRLWRGGSEPLTARSGAKGSAREEKARSTVRDDSIDGH